MINAKKTHESRLKLWDSSISSRKKWVDNRTGIFFEKYVEDRDCPVCLSANKVFLFYKEGGSYQKCLDCSMVFLSPVFKDEYLVEHYQGNHDVQSETVISDLTFYQKIYQLGLDMVFKNQEINSVLDIGCSSGVFLDMCKLLNIRTYGIELNKLEAKKSNENHTVYTCELTELKKELRFDLITMWDVFEHIKDGSLMLQKINEKLVDSGLLFLQIPSVDSLAAKILQSSCNMFDGLEHVNLYNKETIYKLAELSGFDIVSYSTVISEEAVINNYLNYEDPYKGSFSNTDILFSDKYILDNELGYKIQILLRKK